MNPQPKIKTIRLKGKALKDQNQAIIIRDGNLCGVCRCAPPPGNHWTQHHNLYPERADIMDEKISACPECHAMLHDHSVRMSGVWVNLGKKEYTQQWVRERIKSIERGEV